MTSYPRLSTLIALALAGTACSGPSDPPEADDTAIADTEVPDASDTLETDTLSDDISDTDNEVDSDADADVSVDPVATIRLERHAAGAHTFDVVLEVEDGGGNPLAGLEVDIEGCGIVSAVIEPEAGTYRATVTPPGPGECDVVAQVVDHDLTLERRAIIMEVIDDRWGQPQAVRGLVNTGGWDDGLHVSRDGEWLMLHYVAVSFSCVAENDHEACNLAGGPWGAPERPDFPGATRIDDDGVILNACPSLGVPELPLDTVKFVPQAIYGFRRQADGSFAEPFVVTFDNSDACRAIFGPNIYPNDDGTAELLYAFDDPRDDEGESNSTADLYHQTISLGEPVVLGRLDGPYGLEDFTGLPIGGTTLEGWQGNASAHRLDDGRFSTVWVDDESAPEGERDIAVMVNAVPGSLDTPTWEFPERLPEPLNSGEAEEIQPFFDGEQLYFRRGNAIVRSTLVEDGVFDPASWTEPVVELGVTTIDWMTPGSLVTVGEPSVAVRDGHEVLYFAYIIRRENGLLDVEAAYVEAR